MDPRIRSPLSAAPVNRENALQVGIDPRWAPLAMWTTQDLALRLQFRERIVLNPQNLPHSGPVLLAPTHRARWDALMLPMAADAASVDVIAASWSPQRRCEVCRAGF